jgi:hypothetical protein
VVGETTRTAIHAAIPQLNQLPRRTAVTDQIAETLVWQRESCTGSCVTRLPDGTVIRAFWITDREGLWGDGFGYVATVPGTRRGVCGSSRLASLDEVVREASEKVAKALGRQRSPGN